MTQLLSVQAAEQRILAPFQPVVETEPVAYARALHRVLAEPVLARDDFPLFANSSMDGYAVRAADLAGAAPDRPVSLPLRGESAAGSAGNLPLRPGTAMSIMTGAVVPPGADAVIPVEQSRLVENGDRVEFTQAPNPGQYIRPRGEDFSAGQTILEARRRLQPPDIGALAMLGVEEVRVYRRPRVALISSGDELIPPGQPLGPGKIRDANTYLLSAAAEQAQVDVVYTRLARDTRADVASALREAAAAQPDLILSSAGVSVGAYDFIRVVIEEHGRLDFWRVNMRPGKPVAFGAYQGVPVLGLPGNPVSAYVGFLLFVRPVLARLSGARPAPRDLRPVTLGSPVHLDGRETYLRAWVETQEGRWLAHLSGHQGSGNLLSFVHANALLIIPSGVKSLPAGSSVSAWFYSHDIDYQGSGTA